MFIFIITSKLFAIQTKSRDFMKILQTLTLYYTLQNGVGSIRPGRPSNGVKGLGLFILYQAYYVGLRLCAKYLARVT